jgi:hypothetical protein
MWLNFAVQTCKKLRPKLKGKKKPTTPKVKTETWPPMNFTPRLKSNCSLDTPKWAWPTEGDAHQSGSGISSERGREQNDSMQKFISPVMMKNCKKWLQSTKGRISSEGAFGPIVRSVWHTWPTSRLPPAHHAWSEVPCTSIAAINPNEETNWVWSPLVQKVFQPTEKYYVWASSWARE